MTTSLATAPHHNKGFVIVPPPPAEHSEFPLQFSFYGYPHGDTPTKGGNGDAYYIGCLVGDPYKDNDFAKKLDRVRAILHLRGVQHTQTVCRLNLRKVQRLNNEQKYRRKLTRIQNEYGRRHNALAGDIFRDHWIRVLDADYEQTLKVLKQRYQVQ